ncbi:MAG: FAD-dependent oxidoreductase, partial [Thermodesulfobacteriota bacterium]|nr:FAD-dependent oxidoreductase [Thermodesulfobacteriota bacterium]
MNSGIVRQDMTGKRVLVVGGGIAGLSAASALARLGVRVDLVFLAIYLHMLITLNIINCIFFVYQVLF